MMARTQPKATPPLFDQAHLERYTGGDKALTSELLTLMCEQAERCLGLMETAQDATAWTAATHTLKGAARGGGAFALAEVCEQAETVSEPGWDVARLGVERCFRETQAAFAGLV